MAKGYSRREDVIEGDMSQEDIYDYIFEAYYDAINDGISGGYAWDFDFSVDDEGRTHISWWEREGNDNNIHRDVARTESYGNGVRIPGAPPEREALDLPPAEPRTGGDEGRSA